LNALSPAEFAQSIDVSRETVERFQIYAELLQVWQKRINLVSRSTLPDLWRRHFLDSAQLVRHLGAARPPIIDMGSGAGFPGLVLAMLTGHPTILIESDRRKAAFLWSAARQTETTNVTVRTARIEDRRLEGGIITARALAPLPKLLELADMLRADRSRCLFLKGADIELELTAAETKWQIDYELHPSLSDPNGHILIIRDARRRD